MPLVHFRAGDVRELIQHAETSEDRWPILLDLVEPAYRHDGRDPLNDDMMGMPSEKDVDTSRIPAKLILVGDDGIYLMSNGRPVLTRPDDPKKPRVVFAAEANPDRMQHSDVQDAKRHIFGGDDGAEGIDLNMAKTLVQDAADDDYVALEITPENIAVASQKIGSDKATAHWPEKPNGPAPS